MKVKLAVHVCHVNNLERESNSNVDVYVQRYVTPSFPDNVTNIKINQCFIYWLCYNEFPLEVCDFERCTRVGC